jgi:hypothetical protein
MQVELQKQRQTDGKEVPSTLAQEPASDAAGGGTIRHAAWFSDGLLLVAGMIKIDRTRWSTASVRIAGQTLRAEAEAVTCDVPGASTTDSLRETLVLVRCQPGDYTGGLPQGLGLGSGPTAVEFALAHLPSRVTDLSTLLRETVAGLNAAARSRVLQFLVSAVAERLTGLTAASTSMALFAAREALRERLPSPTIAKGHTLGGNIDGFFGLGTNSFYVRGWLASSDWPLQRVTAVSPEGCRTELLDRLFRYRRPELDSLYGAKAEDGAFRKLGFVCYFEARTPSHLGEGWLLEVGNVSGSEIELDMPPPLRDPTTVPKSLLAEFGNEPGNDSALIRDHIVPALTRIQERQRDLVRVEKVVQYGRPAAGSAVSIIIPLCGRIDFLEQQMAQFVHDPEISGADLVYVLDSPELSAAVWAAAPRLERLYRVPFRVASLDSSVGVRGASNAGVALARGRLLVLLHPDVLPDRPGWLARMAAFYNSTPKAGAIGPKLLYEDDAIQHAGLFFYRELESDFWSHESYYKGLHRTFPPASITRVVPAVSAACMMIAADLYRDLGGMSGLYVQEDYEDLDLCLCLAQAGRENWYLSDVELYHLEAQLYPADLGKLTSRYYLWLRSHHRGPFIERIMSESGAAKVDRQ